MSDYIPIDNIPKELIFGMLDQDPSSIKSLHATSTRFCDIVDEYLDGGRKQAAVQKLMFSTPTPAEGDPLRDIRVRAYVPSNMAGLFELRMNRLITIEGASLRIRRQQIIVSGRVFLMYSLTCASVEAARFLARDVIGTHTPPDTAFARLEEVIFDNRDVNDARISEILHGRTFRKMSIFADSLHDDYVTYVANLIETHGVRELWLHVMHANMLTDPSASLSQLACRVDELRIVQRLVTGVHPSAAFFLGRLDTDWAPIFIAMLGQESLKRMYIDNRNYPSYLTRAAADALIYALPRLGRHISFISTCIAYGNGLDSEVNNFRIIAHSRMQGMQGPRLLQVEHL